MNDKIEPKPEEKVDINSYLRKKLRVSKAKESNPEEIKEKYSEQKAPTFRDYAEKIKTKYAQPVEPSLDSKVADIKEKFHQDEKSKADKPARVNTKLAQSKPET